MCRGKMPLHWYGIAIVFIFGVLIYFELDCREKYCSEGKRPMFTRDWVCLCVERAK